MKDKDSKGAMLAILDDPCATYWLKDAVVALSARDPLDARNDAEMLLAWCEHRMEETIHA